MRSFEVATGHVHFESGVFYQFAFLAYAAFLRRPHKRTIFQKEALGILIKSRLDSFFLLSDLFVDTRDELLELPASAGTILLDLAPSEHRHWPAPTVAHGHLAHQVVV